MAKRKASASKTNAKSSHTASSTTHTIDYPGQVFDMAMHAWFSKFTGWLSPASFGAAYFDWLSHLSIAPAKKIDLLNQALQKSLQYTMSGGNPCCERRPNDKRFIDPAWQQFPFNMYSQGFLLAEQWWNNATTNVRGVSKHHENMVNFSARQMLDMFSPSNFSWLNPEVINTAVQTAGQNFVQGTKNFIEDATRQLNNLPPAATEAFKVGETVAITPGKVIYRNRLIELIQYTPTTTNVYAEPVLIIPAWIMKYYILDLSAHNSLVKYLVGQGHTVFMISWKNPDSSDRELGLEDYLELGVMDALNVIGDLIPNKKIHSVGYCLGGTLLMIAASAMAAKNDNRLASITLFAAQVDFKDAGEILLFVDESQVTYLEDIMWEQGYLDGQQMVGAFSMLQSNDLIWSRIIRDYLIGVRRPFNDLIAWDNDTTRLPFRMHSEYLRHLFLNNDLIQGRFKVKGKKIALRDINAPIFAVGTIKDHVAPWKSVYKIDLYVDTDFTFVLTNGGHNAGIVSEPGHKGRQFQMDTRPKGSKYINSEHWQENAPFYEGSWWPAWQRWLVERSAKQKVTAPKQGNSTKGYAVLGDAPGTYVYQK